MTGLLGKRGGVANQWVTVEEFRVQSQPVDNFWHTVIDTPDEHGDCFGHGCVALAIGRATGLEGLGGHGNSLVAPASSQQHIHPAPCEDANRFLRHDACVCATGHVFLAGVRLIGSSSRENLKSSG